MANIPKPSFRYKDKTAGSRSRLLTVSAEAGPCFTLQKRRKDSRRKLCLLGKLEHSYIGPFPTDHFQEADISVLILGIDEEVTKQAVLDEQGRVV
jgi:hypothetical protein